MKKARLNLTLVAEISAHLAFWLIILWVKTESQLYLVSLDGEFAPIERYPTTSLTGIFTFYWFYFLLIPKTFYKSLARFALLALISLIVIAAIDKLLLNIAIIDNTPADFKLRDSVFSINLIAHSFWALCAILIQRTLKKMNNFLIAKEQILQHSQTELAFLKQQIHPHFLFNVLNSLYSCSYSFGDQKTAAGIGQLADLLRYMLYETMSDKVPLKNELLYLDNYIELQRLRFSEDVELDVSFVDQCVETQIAPMLLITLVENAFKHGVIPHSKSTIKINLSVQNNIIHFEVSNQMKPTRTEAQAGGVGLANLRRRLELLYNKKHEFSTSIKQDIFTVKLVLQ